MSNRTRNRGRTRLGQGTLVIVIATLLAAVSMFFASAVDVRAMMTPDQAALRAAAHEPVAMPEEWIWRGPQPVSLEYMYGHHEPPRPDYIVMHRNQ